MKVAHWTAYNGSGMNNVAESIVKAEQKLGIESILCNVQTEDSFERVYDADVHVAHTHFPDKLRRLVTKSLKLVWVGHGTPEHVFQQSVESISKGGYGAGDGFMLLQYWLQHADAIVTFWPRHKAIYDTMVDRGRRVHCFPLGVDLTFWRKQDSQGKFAGAPSLFSCENAHQIKWPLDLFLMWPMVYPHVENALLHVIYLPTDQHRFWFPLVNRNGASYASHISAARFGHEQLRNAFNSVDYFIGLVRYGDHNRASLEAKACGAKVISYTGNEYADYWLPEGDQREQAKKLINILRGEVEARKVEPVPEVLETAANMIKVYEEVLS